MVVVVVIIIIFLVVIVSNSNKIDALTKRVEKLENKS